MALTPTDWSITAGGDIRYDGPGHGVASATYATTIELHRWLQDLADDASSSGNDLLDITDTTPSERNGTDNNITIYAPYNIDQVASEHLYDGSITQAGGDDIWDGFVNYGTEGINIQILQDGAYEVNDFWNQRPDGESTDGLNRNIAAGISHRFMLKVRTAGVDIDGRRVIGMSRELGKTYSEFKSTTSRGNNTLALVNAIDLNNQTAQGTIEGWVTITNTEGYRTMDVDIDTVNEHYYSEYDRGSQSINELYEYVKMETAYDRVGTMYGIDGKIFRGITHEVQVDTPTGTFDAFEEITWGSGATAGMGQMLAINSPDAGTALWMQLITGVVPTDGEVITGGSSGGTVTMDTNIYERTVSPVIIGASTGSAIIGAYGFGVEALDLSSSDKVFSLEDAATPVVPPDYKVTTVGGIIDDDRVLVGPDGGGKTLQDTQLAVSTAITSGATSIIMKSGLETIGTGTQFGTDCPAGGGTVTALRVLDDLGVFWRIPYSAVVHGSGIATFTVSSGDTTGLAAAIDQDGFLAYIDAAETGGNEKISFTTVYHTERSLFVRVRDGGATPIKTFEGSVSLGGSISAIRGSDS